MSEASPLTDSAREAARILFSHWRDGTVLSELPASCRPSTREEGYAVQQALVQESGEPAVGWKIAATSRAGQHHINVSGPIAGRLLQSRVQTSPGELRLGSNRMRVAEAEFAFILARSLPARDASYSTDEVLQAVASVHPAIEIPDSRYLDFTRAGEAQLAADNACAHEFVLGPATTADWRRLDLAAHPVSLRVDGMEVTSGKGSDALGDPRLALVWLANHHAVQGVALQAGDIVTTGVCGNPSTISPPAEVVADFGRLGKVRVRVGE